MAFHHHKKIASLDASSSEKAVLRALADYADHHGKCWPSQETLAEVTGYARETVSRVLKRLVAKGMLRKTTTQFSNRYVLTLPKSRPVCSSITSSVTHDHIQCDSPSQEYTNEQTSEHINESLASLGEDIKKKTKYPTGIPAEQTIALVANNDTKSVKNKGYFTVGDLELVWRELYPLLYPDVGVVKKFTGVDAGMLKHFIKGVAPENPCAILETVMRHWEGYAIHVRTVNGLKTIPTRPVIAFIVKYCGEAGSYHLAKFKVAPVTSMSKPKPQMKKDTIFAEKVAAMPDQKKTTLEDLEALEKELGLCPY